MQKDENQKKDRRDKGEIRLSKRPQKEQRNENTIVRKEKAAEVSKGRFYHSWAMQLPESMSRIGTGRGQPVQEAPPTKADRKSKVPRKKKTWPKVPTRCFLSRDRQQNERKKKAPKTEERTVRKPRGLEKPNASLNLSSPE